MKILRKVNKGLVLTVIVLIILIIYLIVIESQRNSEKPKIEQTCKEYIQLMNEYAVMPKDYQKLYNSNNFLNNEEVERVNDEAQKSINSQMEKLNEKLKEKMIGNELAIQMQKDSIREFLENSNDVFKSVIVNFERDITKIKKFEFDDDQVTVTFNSNIDQEIRYIEEESEENKELSKKNDFDATEETITLKKVDGVWKVVYADLQYDDYTSGYMSTVSYGF